jgi:hypothetical protein
LAIRRPEWQTYAYLYARKRERPDSIHAARPVRTGSDGISGVNSLGNPGADYSVVGIGDYSADGLQDVVLHSITGNDVIWEISNGTVAKVVAAGNPGAGFSTTVVGSDLNAMAILTW